MLISRAETLRCRVATLRCRLGCLKNFISFGLLLHDRRPIQIPPTIFVLALYPSLKQVPKDFFPPNLFL
ncbi:hypothetical protein RchiOBHm_Chr3g0451491 [Rosa chinensis]|uniref:Uncharacterized protein n=1 Tax=Rosa chinensis TaxID=74649 RepID=A0A2P6R617_ROSCH|nr:hypothetical protein RchiOBHm_Chr3g0451491 [Rosa chinensis]